MQTLPSWLSSNGKNQTDLAEIIKKKDVVTHRDRVRAHRIFHGALPNKQEMLLIVRATNFEVDANSFFIPEEVMAERGKRNVENH